MAAAPSPSPPGGGGLPVARSLAFDMDPRLDKGPILDIDEYPSDGERDAPGTLASTLLSPFTSPARHKLEDEGVDRSCVDEAALDAPPAAGGARGAESADATVEAAVRRAAAARASYEAVRPSTPPSIATAALYAAQVEPLDSAPSSPRVVAAGGADAGAAPPPPPLPPLPRDAPPPADGHARAALAALLAAFDARTAEAARLRSRLDATGFGAAARGPRRSAGPSPTSPLSPLSPTTALRRAIEPRGTARKDDDGRSWALRPLRAIAACGYVCDADDDADFDFGDGAAPDWGRAGATRRP